MSNHNKETEARCFHCYRHYVEGTAAWALYMMRMGRKVTNPKDDPRIYHLPEGGMIHVNGIKSIAGNLWIDYWCIDLPDGWQLYEPMPEPQHRRFGQDAARGAGRPGMTEIKLGAASLQMLLDAIDRAEKDADRITAATAHDQLPLIPDVVGSIRSLCSIVLMAIDGDL